MINAQQAQQMYRRPALTTEQIESRIKKAAETQSSLTFDNGDISEQAMDELRNNGFTVLETTFGISVSW